MIKLIKALSFFNYLLNESTKFKIAYKYSSVDFNFNFPGFSLHGKKYMKTNLKFMSYL